MDFKGERWAEGDIHQLLQIFKRWSSWHPLDLFPESVPSKMLQMKDSGPIRYLWSKSFVFLFYMWIILLLFSPTSCNTISFDVFCFHDDLVIFLHIIHISIDSNHCFSLLPMVFFIDKHALKAQNKANRLIYIGIKSFYGNIQ